MPSEYAKTLGARLRAIRTQQGLSLHGVEEKSRGRWKAVVVGSYERGDRSVTVQKLAELAEFYGVPVSELLPGDAAPTPIATAPKLVIDLERMNQLPKEKVGPSPATWPPSRPSAATTTAGCCPCGTRTCARSRSSTTSRRLTSPRSSSAGACLTLTRGATRSSPSDAGPRRSAPLRRPSQRHVQLGLSAPPAVHPA